MHLLYLSPQGSFCLTDDLNEDKPCAIPPYTILSYTWDADENEVTFTDLQKGVAKDKSKSIPNSNFAWSRPEKME